MSEIEQTARPSTKSLRVLLLACAGALLVIIITMTSAAFDARSAQSTQASSANDTNCDMLAYLPAALRENCLKQSGPELR